MTPPDPTTDDTPLAAGHETLDNKRVWRAIAKVGLKEALAGEAKPMVVVCAGLGRTGTSSLKLALKKIGLKPYHMADGVMETKGHMDLWVEHAAQPALRACAPATTDTAGSSDDRTARATALIRRYGYAQQGEGVATVIKGMADAGFDGATDMPACYIWRALATAHPNTKVLLTRRETGEKWSASVLATIGQNIPVFSQAPFKYISMMKQGLVLNHWLWAAVGVPADLWSSEDWTNQGELGRSLAASHDAWAEVVREEYREHSGGDEIIEIIAADGTENWTKLGTLLAGTPYAEPCLALAKAGEPWPYENEAAEMKRIYGVFKAMVFLWKLTPILLVVALLGLAWTMMS